MIQNDQRRKQIANMFAKAVICCKDQQSKQIANNYVCQGSDLQRSAEQTMDLLQLSDQVVHNCQTGEQLMHWDMLNKENSNMVALFKMSQYGDFVPGVCSATKGPLQKW